MTRAALAKGHSVKALTRSHGGRKESELGESGVELVPGSLDDVESIIRAAQDVDAMFAMTTPFAGLETEMQHGFSIAEAARAAEVPHLVRDCGPVDRQPGSTRRHRYNPDPF